MKYFMIAGEASGDLHAAALIESLRKRDPEAQFAFLGGDLMAKAAGTEPIIHYRDMAFMGIGEVVRHAGKVLGNMKRARRAIDEFAPDALILIDYPSFNLKMAKYAKKRGIKVIYYISPKVWAWKEWRVKTIKRVVDVMLCIFPFECWFYNRHGYDVDYVGNPSVQEVKRMMAQAPTRQGFLTRNHLKDRPIIALLPGSRVAEIRSNLPIMAKAVAQFPQYRAVVAGAPGIDPAMYQKYTSLPVVYDQTYDLLAHSHAALVTSGTATLETALIGVPQVAMFRHNGSKLMYWLKNKVIKVPFVTLPNLIAKRQIIPELLLHQCTPEAVVAELAKITPNGEAREQMLRDYEDMRQSLGDRVAPDTAAEIIGYNL